MKRYASQTNNNWFVIKVGNEHIYSCCVVICLSYAWHIHTHTHISFLCSYVFDFTKRFSKFQYSKQVIGLVTSLIHDSKNKEQKLHTIITNGRKSFWQSFCATIVQTTRMPGNMRACASSSFVCYVAKFLQQAELFTVQTKYYYFFSSSRCTKIKLFIWDLISSF